MKTIEWDAVRGGMKKTGTFEAGPFISTNILLHTLNSVLVFFLAWLLTGRNMFASLFSGLLFAVHPMHVESVAWISERKDVLYTFFFLLSLLTWLHYTQAKKPGWYAASLMLFILSCLSKAMAVSLVPVLFLLDWWNGRSLRSAGAWVEKLPFMAAAVLFGLMRDGCTGWRQFSRMAFECGGRKRCHCQYIQSGTARAVCRIWHDAVSSQVFCSVRPVAVLSLSRPVAAWAEDCRRRLLLTPRCFWL
jgi:hypothetical protein